MSSAFGVTVVWHYTNFRTPSLSAVDFWNWPDLELQCSRAAEFHSELVLIMTTKKNCHRNCLICRLSVSGFCVLAARLVQVSNVSCVSHDAARSVPPCISSNNAVSERSVGSNLRMVLTSTVPFFVPTMCSGFVSDLPNQIPVSHAVSLLWTLFPDDNPRCSRAKILNKMVSANGTISCV